jgi:hypothetical protein
MNEAPERIIEERWVKCPPRQVDRRLDALRGRADFLASKIRAGVHRGWQDELEHAALMWAIAELSGIGDELRQRNAERAEERGANKQQIAKQAAHYKQLSEQLRVSNAALKAQNHSLRVLMDALT